MPGKTVIGAGRQHDAAGAASLRVCFTQRNLKLLGSVFGVFAALNAAHVAAQPALASAARAMLAISLIRLLVLAVPRPGSAPWRRWRWHAALVTDWCFSLAAGLTAGLAIHCRAGGGVEALMVTHVILYSASIAVHGGNRSRMTIAQMTITLAPVCLFAALGPEIATRQLALVILCALPAMVGICLNITRILADSLTAAETSAHLAERMQTIAHTDALTGLSNRAGLDRQLHELSSALAPTQQLAVFWLDLDRFKEVNDTLGHAVGDTVLTVVAGRLAGLAPAGACIGRFGGDEFIIAVEGLNSTAAGALATALLAALSAPIAVGGQHIEVGGSIGIAMQPHDGADVEAVMQAADLALHHAKLGGRARHCFFEAAMTHSLLRRREIGGELRRALQNDELSVFFQPVVDLASGRVRSFEALVRWFHPEKGELLPDEFIPVAEETGAIITLGNWITAQAARVAATWPQDISIAVNLSPLQIRAPGAALAILAALREARLAPSRLELEITERVLLDHSPATDAFITELAAAGVRFALDDFGAGYSSLAYLDRYPFTRIKIDRSFVSGINAGPKSEAIIRAVSTLGGALGMEIVAEGLESDAQARAALAAGCTYGQGWLYSQAVPEHVATGILDMQSRAEAGPLAQRA